MKVRTRIAPSPTGEDLHIGTLYTALLNYAYAKKFKGKFIVRIEDTDRVRFVEGSEEKMLSTLQKFGLIYDEGPYRQSDRVDIYKKYANELIEKKAAYYCFCSKERLDKIREEQKRKGQIPKYDKHCLKVKSHPSTALGTGNSKLENEGQYVVRLNVLENKTISFKDEIRGEVSFSSNDIDDQVLIKSDGFPTYHLAVVVDDHLMEISHVIRGEDWISSTPKHVILYESFGWEMPILAHIPLLRNPDHSKLSKRKNPVWASGYLEEGFLPDAILNFLSLMGWSHPQEKEIFSLDEFISLFDLKDVKPVGPVFDIEKLKWMNGEYLRKTQNSKLKTQIYKFYKQKYSEEFIEQVLPIAKERMKTLKEFGELVDPFVEKQKLELSEEEKSLRKELLERFVKMQSWNSESITQQLKDYAKEKGINFKTYYKVITGRSAGLPLGDMFAIIGREKTLTLLS